MKLHTLPIFDSLSHVTPDGKWFDTSHDASLPRLLQAFEQNPMLQKTLLVGLPHYHLDFLIKVTQQFPDKFTAIAPLELSQEENWSAQFNMLKQQGFRGIKIHPRLLDINLNDKRIIKAIRLAADQGLITLLCTIHRAPSAPLQMPVSEALYNICWQTKGAKLILLHGGYYDLLATSEIIRSFESVLLDLSATITRFQDTHLSSTMAFLFEYFDRRLCIGSDFPEYTIADVMQCIADKILVGKNIAEEKLANIFYHNLCRFVDAA